MNLCHDTLKEDSLDEMNVFGLQVASVEGFINSVESQMRQREEQQKLATISARIDSYEVVEGSSEETEKVRTVYWPPEPYPPFENALRPHVKLCFLSCLSDPQGVQQLQPHDSHERSFTRGDATAASGGSAEDERGQRQSGETDVSHVCLTAASRYTKKQQIMFLSGLT